MNLPGKGIYQISSSANGYSDFVKSIKLDSLQNEARFILVAQKRPVKAATSTGSLAASTAPARLIPSKTEPMPPMVPGKAPAPKSPFGLLEKGNPVVLNNLYFDQSSPVLREQSYPELDRLYASINREPISPGRDSGSYR